MDTNTFIRGLVLGVSIAAPVGPMGLLCMRRTLAGGFAAGLISGLGVATADALYGALAAFGLTLVTSLLLGQQVWLRIVGGLFLCYLGLRTLRSRPVDRALTTSGSGLAGQYMSTFALTLTNPATILSFAAIFAGVGLGSGDGGHAAAALLVLGVFLGSSLWWLILASGIATMRGRLTLGALRWANVLSGLVIAGFGLLALASGLEALRP